MKTAIKFLLAAELCFLNAGSNATTWQTVSYGYWNSPAVWKDGNVPGYSSSDTLLVYHPVIIDGNLTLNNNAYLLIDSSGGLCGHITMTVNTGARFIKYGILELDILTVPGGNVLFYQPGDVILTEYATISNGGALSSLGPQVMVGPWFDCRAQEFWFAPVNEPQGESKKISVYYDYADRELNVLKNKQGLIVVISDAAGRQSEMININEGDNRISLKEFSEGIYFYRIFNADFNTIRGKFIITN